MSTPGLRELAKESVVFERAYAPIPFTLPSHMSLMTGLYPDSHGVTAEDARLPEGAATLSSMLKGAGYRTIHAGKAHWVQFQLEGRESNRDAVGARVWVTAGGRTQVSFVNGGNGFASQSSRRVHFGLGGTATIQKLKVAWPSGRTETFENVKADQIYRIIEGAGRLADFGTREGRTRKGKTKKTEGK